MRHYVFGYGSLICSESRAVTAAALCGSDGDIGGAIPVRLKNWVRLWNVRGRNTNTYLGVQSIETRGAATSRSQPPRSCVGVLVPLPSSNDDDEALKALDRREAAYKRQRVDLGSIERVDDLLIDEDGYTSDNESEMGNDIQENKEAIHNKYYKDTYLWKRPPGNDANANESEEEVCVWVYVPVEEYTGMARAENPILQSYVDVCVKGCLSISKAFAKEFVDGTYGWYPGHSHHDGNTNDETENDNEEGAGDDSSFCWIDDRNDPMYIRANKEYSLENSKALDAVFDPIILRRRR